MGSFDRLDDDDQSSTVEFGGVEHPPERVEQELTSESLGWLGGRPMSDAMGIRAHRANRAVRSTSPDCSTRSRAECAY